MDIDLADLPDNVETLQRMVRMLATDRASLTEAQAGSAVDAITATAMVAR